MDGGESEERRWHLDRRVPIAIIITLSIQTAAVVGWASKLDERVNVLEKSASAGAQQIERIVRLETKMDGVAEILNEIKILLRTKNASSVP